MDLAATSLEAYALFSAPRDRDPPSRRPDAPPPRRAPRADRPRRVPIGWLAGAFYGLILGALMLGITAAGRPQDVARCAAMGLCAVICAQTALVLRGRALVLAQALTTPALALAITSLGALARLSV